MIPLSWESRDFYKDLGLPKHANHQQIKDAYRALVKKLHPDVNSGNDRSAQFQSATEAFNVLSNPEKRALYDSYTSGPEAIFDPAPMLAPLKRKEKPKLLARTLLFISLALLVRNLNYPATAGSAITDGSPNLTAIGQVGQQSENSSNDAASGVSHSNLNQSLVLIAGPQGAPGVAGIAGKDGFIGLNGYQGRDGFAGAPGIAGSNGATGSPGANGATGSPGSNGATGSPGANGTAGAVGAVGAPGAAGIAGAAGGVGAAGSGVVVVPLTADDTNCSLGGTKFISATGTISYTCNGASGVSRGGGNISIGSCDSSVSLSLQTTYTNGDFMMSGLRLSQLSFACSGNTLTIIIQVKSPGSNVTKYGAASTYELGDVIVCSATLALSVGEANIVTLNNTNCANQNTLGARAAFQLSDLSARDVKDGSGALAIQISG